MYWWLRAALAPLVLLNMAFSGILQARRPSAYHDAPPNSGLSVFKALPRLDPARHPWSGYLRFPTLRLGPRTAPKGSHMTAARQAQDVAPTRLGKASCDAEATRAWASARR